MSADNDLISHIIPSLDDWPINQFANDREGFVKRLIDFTLERLVNSSNSSEELLNKSIYLEKQRSKNNPWKVDPPDEYKYWSSLEREMTAAGDSDEPEKQRLRILQRIVHRYSEEILGDFKPRTYLFMRKFLRALFKRLLNNGWGRGQRFIWGSKADLFRKIHVDGYIKEIRSLFDKGTVVIVPTHYSNLDSILVGYGIDSKVGIPAFAYGAGLNLYDWELVAYFINRLGAYRVDRRKKNPIYLETLKSMASLSLIEGVNHIFFPGGTRSRSGEIENRLKLGLLNSAIDAQRHCILNDVNKKIFIVPLSVGYHFVLEAKSLIDQHLRKIGKEKYSRERNKSSMFRTVLRFFRLLRNKDSEIYLSFGQPMDVLGNAVNLDGVSVDNRDKEIDIRNYFTSGDATNADVQRESVYTRILADKIVESFHKENIVLSSHLVSYTLFKHIESLNPEMDLFELLKIPLKNLLIPIDDILVKLERYQKVLQARSEEGTAKLSKSIFLSPRECLEDGIKHVGIYHQNRVIKKSNSDILRTEDLKLLYYYHNKMMHFDLQSEK